MSHSVKLKLCEVETVCTETVYSLNQSRKKNLTETTCSLFTALADHSPLLLSQALQSLISCFRFDWEENTLSLSSHGNLPCANSTLVAMENQICDLGAFCLYVGWESSPLLGRNIPRWLCATSHIYVRASSCRGGCLLNKVPFPLSRTFLASLIAEVARSWPSSDQTFLTASCDRR